MKVDRIAASSTFVIGATATASPRSGGTSASARAEDALAAAGPGGPARPSADRSSLSSPGKALSRLKTLRETDPARFAQVVSTIAARLSEASQAATDPRQKAALTAMAKKFGVDVAPPTSWAMPPFEPPDTNEDGSVTQEERAVFDAKQALGAYQRLSAGSALTEMKSRVMTIVDVAIEEPAPIRRAG